MRSLPKAKQSLVTQKLLEVEKWSSEGDTVPSKANFHMQLRWRGNHDGQLLPLKLSAPRLSVSYTTSVSR